MVRRELRSAIIGMVAGDASLRQYSRYGVQIRITHAERQKDYLLFKRDILQKLFRHWTISVSAIDRYGYAGVKLETRKHSKLRALYKWFYPGGKKYFTRRVLNYLTPLGLAIWYMDDGSLAYHKRNGLIHGREITLNTYCSYEEAMTIREYFQEKWNVNWRVNRSKNGFRLSMGTTEAMKFFSIIRSYIVPSMQYKIDLKYLKPPRTRIIREALADL